MFLYFSSIDKSASKQVVISNSVAVQVRISKRVSRSVRLLYTSTCVLNLNLQPSNVLRNIDALRGIHVITWCVRTSKPDACASIFLYVGTSSSPIKSVMASYIGVHNCFRCISEIAGSSNLTPNR